MVSKVPNTFTTSVIQFLLYTQSWSLGFVHRNGSMCLWVCRMCVGLCMMWVSVHSHDYFRPDIIALGLQEVVNRQRIQNSSQNHLTVRWELQCNVMKQFSNKKYYYYNNTHHIFYIFVKTASYLILLLINIIIIIALVVVLWIVLDYKAYRL